MTSRVVICREIGQMEKLGGTGVRLSKGRARCRHLLLVWGLFSSPLLGQFIRFCGSGQYLFFCLLYLLSRDDYPLWSGE